MIHNLCPSLPKWKNPLITLISSPSHSETTFASTAGTAALRASISHTSLPVFGHANEVCRCAKIERLLYSSKRGGVFDMCRCVDCPVSNFSLHFLVPFLSLLLLLSTLGPLAIRLPCSYESWIIKYRRTPCCRNRRSDLESRVDTIPVQPPL